MKLLLTLLSFFAAIFTSYSQQTGNLNLKKGQKYVVENIITTVSSSEMMGQNIESKADVASSYLIEVKDFQGNNINLENMVNSLKMNMNAMGQDYSFDSDKPEDMNGDMGKNFNSFIKVPQKVIIDKSGNVVPSSLPDTSESMRESQSTDPSSMIMTQMGGDPADLGYGAKMAFHPLPLKASTGTNWQDSSSENGITRVTKYILQEINGSEGKIKIQGTLVTDTKNEMQGMEILSKSTGKFEGEEIVDIKSGVVKSSNVITKAAGTVTVMGQDLPNTSTITSATTVKVL
ncbi:MAG: DUF6263 family protein [Ginsengibacter sp.]